MPDEIRTNRPQQPMPRYDAAPATGVAEAKANPPASRLPWIILGLIVVVIIVLGVLFRDRLFGGKSGAVLGASTSMEASSGYQAVFLTNGQVYFGKLADADSDYPVLTDIYYLQVVQPPLQGQQTQTQAATSQSQPQISLVKLGNELHGPVDEMHIAKSQILFYEDMKQDSQVYKAIEAYKANPTGQQAPTDDNTTPPADAVTPPAAIPSK